LDGPRQVGTIRGRREQEETTAVTAQVSGRLSTSPASPDPLWIKRFGFCRRLARNRTQGQSWSSRRCALAGPVLAALRAAGRVAFVFTEVSTFTGDRISRLETFHLNVGGPGDTLFTAPAG
jgi:hypothetical protein